MLWVEIQEFYFRHVIFEMLIRHPSGNLKQPVIHTSLNLRRGVVAEEYELEHTEGE